MAGRIWDDDEYLDAARKLAGESEADLRARLVAQSLRLADEGEKHLAAMLANSTWPTPVSNIAELLLKRPELVEPTRAFIESELQRMLDELNDDEPNEPTEPNPDA